eukprot:285694-Chlamydomonas_euryale.AAC.3
MRRHGCTIGRPCGGLVRLGGHAVSRTDTDAGTVEQVAGVAAVSDARWRAGERGAAPGLRRGTRRGCEGGRVFMAR